MASGIERMMYYYTEFIKHYDIPDKIERYSKLREVFKAAQDELEDTDYVTLLDVGSELAWKNTKDTVLVYAMNIEAEHVLPSNTEDFGGTKKENDLIKKTLKKYRSNEEGLLSMLWPATYILGTGCVGSYMSYQLGDIYEDKGDLKKAWYYMRQSLEWYLMNEHQVKWTNGMQRAFAKMSYDKLSDKLRDEGNLYEMFFSLSDVSDEAKRARLRFKYFIDADERNDSLLALPARELGIDYYNSGDFELAETYLTKSVECYKTMNDLSQRDRDKKSDTYRILGDLFKMKGEIQKAEKAYQSAIADYDPENNYCPTNFYIACQHLAELYIANRNNLKAARILKLSDTFDPEVKMKGAIGPYISMLENYGVSPVNDEEAALTVVVKNCIEKIKYDIAKGWSPEAIEQALNVKSIIDSHYEKFQSSSIYYELLASLGDAYMADKQHDNALACYRDVIENPQYSEPEQVLAVYANMVKIAADNGNIGNLINFADAAVDYLNDYINTGIVRLTEEYRVKLWGQIIKHITEMQGRYMEAFIDGMDVSPIPMLRMSLLTKGFLLQSANDVKNAVLATKDDKLKRLYSDLISAKDDDAPIEIIRELELKLINSPKLAKVLERQRRWNSIDYGNIRAQLKPNELAIEFVNFPVSRNYYTLHSTTNAYGAIIIAPGKDPVMIFLGSAEDFKYDFTNNTSNIYEVVWKPILDKAGECDKIYFSPSGIFNALPLEYAFPGEGLQPKAKRLTTLKNLNMNQGTGRMQNVMAYGGISYDADLLVASAQSADMVADIRSRFRGDEDMRAGFSPLPYTREEIVSIKGIMDKTGKFSVDTVSGMQATEETVKAMSGSNINILHIATHGFFWKDKRKLDKLNLKTGELSNEDLAMYGSGLLLAGGNNILKGRKLPTSAEDGILTAREIAQLDFSNMALVVLSACETGKGEISDDGVFGLQRGFKKAGTSRMLLSLQKVPDKETKELMETFYLHLSQGKTIHEAFDLARNEMKIKFPASNVWYSFILIDDVA